MTEKCDIYVLDRDPFRANLLKFTKKAFSLLPQLDQPRILDVGCGSGVTTMELARLGGGEVVGLDIDQRALDKLIKKAAAENLSDKILVICSSMNEMLFPPDSFDVLWTEGAISYMGFERALKEWRKFLVPRGFFVIHERLAVLKSNIEIAEKSGYAVLQHFQLPRDAWWNEYYLPLKKHVEKLHLSVSGNEGFRDELEAIENEIRNFDRDSDMYGSAFLLLRKL